MCKRLQSACQAAGYARTSIHSILPVTILRNMPSEAWGSTGGDRATTEPAGATSDCLADGYTVYRVGWALTYSTLDLKK
jgi:hypothetical protein